MLSAASGVDGCIFVHASGFIGGMSIVLVNTQTPLIDGNARQQDEGRGVTHGQTCAIDVNARKHGIAIQNTTST